MEVLFKNKGYTIYKEEGRYYVEYDYGYGLQLITVYKNQCPVVPGKQLYGVDFPEHLPKYIHKEIRRIAEEVIIKVNTEGCENVEW